MFPLDTAAKENQASPSTSSHALPPRTGHVPGEAGLWVLLFGDLLVFAVFFGAFVFYRSQEPELFQKSQETLIQEYGAVNTLLLLVSSLLVVIGVMAIRNNIGRVAPMMFIGAIVCGLGFSCIKFLEYEEKLTAGITPSTNKFYTLYFVFTGIHFFHLIIGLGVLIVLWVLSRKESLTGRQFVFIEGGACFWHMVDMLWIILFSLIYLVK